MASDQPSELSLDSKPQSDSMLLKSFGDYPQNDQTTQKLEEFLAHLEEERLKIDVFKRELPLCMQLLTNAVEVYRQQLQLHKSNNNNKDQGSKPVLEEFMPVKNSSSENPEKTDKSNWMISARLWSQNTLAETKPNVYTASQATKECTEIGLSVGSPSRLRSSSIEAKPARNGSGAFIPFSKKNLPELALVSSDNKENIEDKKLCSSDQSGKACVSNTSCSGNSGSPGQAMNIEQSKASNGNLTDQAQSNNNASSANTTGQTHRKARRCWSPDLHRRFVNALQMLGGSQVATPKQIRELMKVDGLTNDEVKSHLQKYRLHTRRPSPSPAATVAPAPHLVVLGGIWVPSDYAAASPTTLYAPHHPHAPPHPHHHFCSPQDFYSSAHAPPLPPPAAIHSYKPQSHAPDHSPGDTAVDSGEEAKSESGERRSLAALREEAEESNGSEITLKF